MGLRVTIDMCSGRPNPSWEITDPDRVHELVTLLEAERDALGEVGSGYTGLGFRGVHVDVTADPRTERSALGGLPPSFELAGGGTKDASAAAELAERLLATIPYDLGEGGGVDVGSTRYADLVLETARQEVARTVGNGPDAATYRATTEEGPRSTMDEEALEQLRALRSRDVSCPYDSYPYNPAFWGQPSIEPYNNCYAYAVSRVVNVFARPGLAHGYTIPATMLGFQVAVGCYKDGLNLWGYPCRPEGSLRFVIALYTGAFPSGFRDFHFYRWHAEGYWSHKHAGNAVRRTDASGNLITDLSTMNPGTVYTEYYALFQSHNTVVIA
ncbi:hypothetical protein ACH4M4_30740 [Streptomyces sp. NPDC017254]|uniref:hypothetical protein n=1 Tax=unclassified Streptomyces TaxID=2593676 RepID=UPI0037B48642